jgi:hypothetical protein
MNCPHCGADASAGQKFCPKCSRLVDSPLLKIKQQIDAARDEIRRDLYAHRVSISQRPPQPPPHYQVRVDAPVYSPPPPPPSPPPPSAYKYAPHPSQTPALTRPSSEVPRETILRSQERNQKNQRKKKRDQDSGTTRAQHTNTTHRFDPSAEAKKAMQQAKAAEAAGPVPERFKRPASFTVLALLDLIGAAVMFYTAMQLTMQYPEPRPPIIEFSRILAGATAFLFVIAAFGMLKLHPYGRFFQRLFLLPVMLWFPIGTIYGFAVWVYLGTGITRLYFSGRSPRSLDARQLAAWRTADKASPVFAFLIFAFGFIPGLAYATFISNTLPVAFNEAERMFPQAFSQLTQTPALEGGASAAAAAASAATTLAANDAGTPVPSASSTDGAPEGDSASIAFKEVRLMQQAQAAYASLNEGYYDRLECVLTPSMCIRNGDERNKAVLLDQSFIPPQRHGYTFLLNQYGEPAVRSETASATGTRGYSYRALPAADSGDRIGYCGDETGIICTFDAQTPDGGNFGRGPAVCRPVQ